MMKRLVSTLSLISYAAVILGSASAITLGTSGSVMANSKCGGLNQKVCKKWVQRRGCDKGLHRTKPIGGICTRDNRLIPNPIERIILKRYEPSQRDCGANGQRVCRKNEQLRGCDPGFHRTSLINGICTTDNKLVPDLLENSKALKEAARNVIRNTSQQQRILGGIVKCIQRNKAAFKRAVENQDKQAASQISFQCIDPNTLSALRVAPSNVNSTRSNSNSSGGAFRTLSVGIGGGGMFFVGGAGESGIVFALDGETVPKFYTSGGIKYGPGIGGGADIIVGLGIDPLSAGTTYNTSINFAGEVWLGGAVSIGFDRGGLLLLDSVAVSGGVGVSGEALVIHKTKTRIY